MKTRFNKAGNSVAVTITKRMALSKLRKAEK